MKLDDALAIQGWMDVRELVWLAEQAEKYQRICEVGSWKGRSTTVLANNTKGVIYAVDTWLGSVEHNPPVAGLYEEFCWNLRDHIASGRVVPVRLPSVEAAAFLKDMRFDMVFIDASHDTENVKADINAWKPLVRFGGIICGHDRGYPPVTQAVQETLGTPGGETDIWVVTL